MAEIAEDTSGDPRDWPRNSIYCLYSHHWLELVPRSPVPPAPPDDANF